MTLNDAEAWIRQPSITNVKRLTTEASERCGKLAVG
jgi:hypothetical protein